MILVPRDLDCFRHKMTSPVAPPVCPRLTRNPNSRVLHVSWNGGPTVPCTGNLVYLGGRQAVSSDGLCDAKSGGDRPSSCQIQQGRCCWLTWQSPRCWYPFLNMRRVCHIYIYIYIYDSPSCWVTFTTGWLAWCGFTQEQFSQLLQFSANDWGFQLVPNVSDVPDVCTKSVVIWDHRKEELKVVCPTWWASRKRTLFWCYSLLLLFSIVDVTT